MNIKIGCSGFPVNMKEYFGSLAFVETDKTFLGMPSVSTAKRWRREAPRDFEFAIKAPKVITGPEESPFGRTDTVLRAWEKTLEVASILEAKVIVFNTPPSFGPGRPASDKMREFFSFIERAGRDMVWEAQGKWSESEIRAICEELDLVHCADPFKATVQCGKMRYFRLGGKEASDARYKGIDLKRLRDFCEDESSRIGEGRIYVVFNNDDMMHDALRFDWIMKNTGRIKEINLSFLQGLCNEIEAEEEDEKVRRLSIEAERIIMLILHTEYARVDIEIEKSKLRELCKDLFPGKEYLYEIIYAKRFDRLWEQFREHREES